MFKDRLKELLAIKKTTLYRLGKDLGFSGSTARHWVLRGSLPSAKNLEKVADYLGTTTKHLLGED